MIKRHPVIATILICAVVAFAVTSIAINVLGADYHLLNCHVDMSIGVTLFSCLLLLVCRKLCRSSSQTISVFIVYVFCVGVLYALFIITYPNGSFPRYLIDFRSGISEQIQFWHVKSRIKKGMDCEEVSRLFPMDHDQFAGPQECRIFPADEELIADRKEFPVSPYCAPGVRIGVFYDRNGKVVRVNKVGRGGCSPD